MTNPLPHPGPDASLPANNGAVTEQTAKTRRKAPRRANAPAGAPAKTATPALMLVDVAGMIVPSTLPEHDAGDSPQPEPAPAAEVETSNETPMVLATVEGAAEAEAEAEVEVAVDIEGADAAEGKGQVETVVDPTIEDEVPEPAAATTDIAQKDEPEAAEAPADVAAEQTADSATQADTDNAAEPEPTAEGKGQVETVVDPTLDPAIEAEAEAPAAAKTDTPVKTDSPVKDEPEAAEAPTDAEVEVELPADAATKTEPESESESETETETQPAVDEPTAAQESDSEVPEAADAAAETPVLETDIAPDVAADIDAPAGLTETTPTAPEVGDDGNPAEGPLPQSRRERRLAEQKLGSAVVPPTNETDAEAAKPAEEVKEPAPAKLARPAKPTKPVRKRGRLAGFMRAFMLLLVISALVLSLGTVLSGTADNHAGPSQTEADRQSAWEATNSLLAQAVELGTAGNQPDVQELLAQAATDLATQGAALSDGLPTGPATATASATTQVPATLADFVLSLRSSGESLLQDAVGADHAMGRVFAAVGTSQLLRSQALSAAADLGSGNSPALPASVNFPAPDAPECSSTLDPRPGATIDAALLAAAESEQKAVYAYQVTTAHLSEAQFKRGTQLLARHEAKLSSLNAELEVRCLPGTPLVPGFELDETFTTHPAAALASLEGVLTAVYADLAALSTAPATGTAGTETPPSADVLSTNTTQLREMAVAWLLDSADAQTQWGGSVGALAGMDSNS